VQFTQSYKLVIRKKLYLARKTTDHCFYMPQNERARLKEGDLMSTKLKTIDKCKLLREPFCRENCKAGDEIYISEKS
jgi:hypothetical protein